MNSCNPVFIELGERLGVENYYKYFKQFGLTQKTGIDLPGEAATIMHKQENVGPVELATISFGQSFQITPIQLVTTVSSIINGGTRITPHFGVEVRETDGTLVETFSYDKREEICRGETSETMQYLLEKVVSEGAERMRDRGVCDRRQDRDFPDTAEKRAPLYFLVPRICSCGRSQSACDCDYQ